MQNVAKIKKKIFLKCIYTFFLTNLLVAQVLVLRLMSILPKKNAFILTNKK